MSPQDITNSSEPPTFIEEKISFWQRFKFLSPKKKIFLLGVFVVILVGTIYLIAAPAVDRPEFSLEPPLGNFAQGQTFSLGINIDTFGQEVIVASAFLNFDPDFLEVINIDSSGSNFTIGDPSKLEKYDNSQGTISITRGASPPGIKSPDVYFATINFRVKSTAPLGDTQVSFNQSSSAMVKSDGTSLVLDWPQGGNYTYNVLAAGPTGTGFSLSPSSRSADVGESFPVEIIINTGNQDIVAASAYLNYNSSLLSVESIDINEPTFPQGEGAEIIDGEIRILRGAPGDGDPDAGPGVRGDSVRLATINFEALAEGTASVTFDQANSILIKDDGQGTNLCADSGCSFTNGSYTIGPAGPEELDIIDVKISTNCGTQPGSCQAIIQWQTDPRILSDSRVDYGLTTAYGSSESSSQFVYLHIITLSNLEAEETYHYKITSTAPGPPSLIGTITGSFPTPPLGAKELLEITNLSVDPSYNSAVVSWMTNLEAICIVTNNGQTYTTTPATTHSATFTGLEKCTDYTYSVDCSADPQTASDSITKKTECGEVIPDANIILKVDRDRICDKWLYCRSSVEAVTSKGKKENLCFDIGLCHKLDESGQCVAPLELEESLRKADWTFNQPQEIEKIKNLSGYSKIGLKWSEDEIIPGYYHYAIMKPTGTDLILVNSDFESSFLYPWQSDIGELNIVDDQYFPGNHILKITPQGGAVNTYAPMGEISPGHTYAISFNSRTESGEKTIRVQIRQGDIYTLIKEVKISSGWQTIALTSEGKDLPAGEIDLNFYAPDSDQPFYLDNVYLKSLLEKAAPDSLEPPDYALVPRSCRLYAKSDAPDCDFIDLVSGKTYYGWKGFCAEKDPLYEKMEKGEKYPYMCLNWWPVDLIPGEANALGQDLQAGYKDRYPLYYCLEASGNYPYKRRVETDKPSWSGPAEGVAGLLWSLEDEWENTSGINNLYYRTGSSEQSKIHDLREIDIERIVLEPLCDEANTHCFSKIKNSKAWITLTKANNWAGYMCVGEKCPTKLNTWEEYRPYISESKEDFFAARIIFNKDGKVDYIEAGLYNAHGGHGFVKYGLNFYLREPCNVLAQVVSPFGENKAWTSRVQKGGWSEDNYLKYQYNQDFSPYGASVVPSPADDPSAWKEPLYVEPPDSSPGQQFPYQARAGSPYAVSGGTLTGICTEGKKIGQSCSSNEACNSPGKCIYNSSGSSCSVGALIDYNVCIGGDRNKIGQPCTQPSDCNLTGYPGSGICALPHEGYCDALWIYVAQSCTAPSDCLEYPQAPYRSCETGTTGTACLYETVPSDNLCYISGSGVCGGISAPSDNIGETTCVSGSSSKLGQSCNNNSDCGFDPETSQYGKCIGIKLSEEQKAVIGGGLEGGKTKLSQLFAKSYSIWRWTPAENKYEKISPDWDITSTGNPPQVKNLTINEVEKGDVKIKEVGGVALRFTSHLDLNQLPLTAIKVDWGDGTQFSELNNLKIAPREDSRNPHLMLHTYKYNPAYPCVDIANASCFKPKVQIQDNWGWCNNGYQCPAHSATTPWKEFSGWVIVTSE